jgi:hypothetical protein
MAPSSDAGAPEVNEDQVCQHTTQHLLVDLVDKSAPYVNAVVSKALHYLIKSVTWPPLSDSSYIHTYIHAYIHTYIHTLHTYMHATY